MTAGDVVPRHSLRLAVLREAAAAGPWLVAGGVALAIGWRVLAPLLRSLGDPGEAVVAGDAGYALPAVALGLVTAALLVVRPGRSPVTRFVVVVVLATLSAVAAWGIGELAGAPPLLARGALLLWPTVTALVQLLWTVIQLVTAPE